ncbi:MAG: DUF3857 domain-containing protein [bacterium]
MKKILFIAAILSTFHFPLSILHAQQPDAVFKLLRYEWTLNGDGTSDYHYRHEVQILRNRALVAYADKGETFVVYNPDLEELTVNEVYTLRADGSRVDMPQNAFIYQLPSECADCGRFNHLRELAMVHTGMELGCTIVVDYTIHRQYNLLNETLPLRRECPVEKMEVVVQCPQDMEWHNQFNWGSSTAAIGTNAQTAEAANGAVRTTFTFTNCPQAPREPYMPADIIPYFRLYNGTPNHTPTFNQEPFAAAKDAMGQTMTSGKPMEDIAAARDFVIGNIHLNDIHPSHLGYRHSTPAEVWATGCGTAIDKAVLLAAILNAQGYQARVTGDNMDAVGVMIDTLEYRLDVRHRIAPELIGEAKDEVSKADINETLDATLDSLEDGFFRLVLAPIPQAQQPLASTLSMVRTTPLATSACDIRSNYTYLLPKDVKLVGGAISHKLSNAVGNLEISIKQSGKKIKVIRNLTIDKSVIAVDQYADYRSLIALWQSVDSLLLRKK